MSYITDNWLLGDPKRNRNHLPDPVSVVAYRPKGAWCDKHRIASGISWTLNRNQKYQLLYLTQPDVESLVRGLWKDLEPRAQAALVEDALARMTDKALLGALRNALQARGKGGRKSDG
jgi:hypothetical protein